MKGEMRPRLSVLWVTLALSAAACSTTSAGTTTTSQAPVVDTDETTTTTIVTTTQPVVSIDATFALGTVVFGEQGWIEVVNTGPQTGNVHGYWIAVHPFYLELPSAILEVGEAVTVTLDPDEGASALVHAFGLLPALAAPGGEVGLYSHGQFGDPGAIVDYVEWGSGGHFRSTVAIAAGVWDETRIVAMGGDEGGLLVVGGAAPQILDADLAPVLAEG